MGLHATQYDLFRTRRAFSENRSVKVPRSAALEYHRCKLPVQQRPRPTRRSDLIDTIEPTVDIAGTGSKENSRSVSRRQWHQACSSFPHHLASPAAIPGHTHTQPRRQISTHHNNTHQDNTSTSTASTRLRRHRRRRSARRGMST